MQELITNGEGNDTIQRITEEQKEITIGMEEVEEAIRNIKVGQSSGIDDVSPKIENMRENLEQRHHGEDLTWQ